MGHSIFDQETILLPIKGKQVKAKINEQVVITDPKTGRRVFNVTVPSLAIYKPESVLSNEIGVLVIPGGAFHNLPYDKEGVNIANSLAAKGYTAAVLKYRLVEMKDEDPFEQLRQNSENFDRLESAMAPVIPLAIEDGKTAMKYLKDHASQLGINGEKVGVIGFSAGGTIAGAIALDKEIRPLFSAPIYPYLDPVMDFEVPSDPPPVFIAVTEDDDFGFDSNSLRFYEKWKAAEGLVDLHIFSKGRHGFASKTQNLPVDHWMELLLEWLSSMGYASKIFQ